VRLESGEFRLRRERAKTRATNRLFRVLRVADHIAEAGEMYELEDGARRHCRTIRVLPAPRHGSVGTKAHVQAD
jgi:hypothetical protein